MIEKKQSEVLPSDIGVYLFKIGDEVLYVGKSINIKARVRSHLENAKLDRKEFLIVNSSDSIETVIVDSEFKALIIESQLIKKYHPKYNVIWKDGKSYLYIKVTESEVYPKILLSRKENDKESLYFGPFSSVKVAESLINDVRHIIPFCTQKKLSKTPCFYSKINLCRPCPNLINLRDGEEKKDLKSLYRKNIKKVVKILKGGVTDILTGLYRELKKLTKLKKYEEAIPIRNKIFRLERLINHPVSNLDILKTNMSNTENLAIFFKELKKYFPDLKKLARIEAYDISNLRESNQVGSMVVLTNGSVDKKEYRRFQIKNQKLKSDFERLVEVIERRFKNNWPKPDLLVVDGGRPQVKTVMEVMNKIKMVIPILGIAKNPDRLVIGSSGFPTVRFPQTYPAFNLVRLIRDESHRFAKKYHLYLRKRDFLV